MKAAVCREFGAPLRIEELSLAATGPGEVRVRIAAVAICHSDISYIDGAWGGSLPAVYGHECAGTVEEVGEGVTTVRPGDTVVVTLIRSCGHCHGCSMGRPVTCSTQFRLDAETPLRDADGKPVAQVMRTGGFAEQVLVHESQCVAIPARVPSASAALLACGVITGFGAVTNTAKVPAGSHVVVIGTGGVGLNSIQGARVAGARTVVAVDIAGVPKVEAFRVRPAADGSLACTAADAIVTGSIQYEDRFANLGWWRDLASTASWPIELPEERSFDAIIEYAADSCCAGDISVSVMQDGKVFFPGLAQLPPRKGWGDFITVPLGRFTVPAGRSEITVKAATKNGDSFINLRRITLKPLR